MPRHSPNALTSHLRVHTTNDNPDIPAVGMAFSVVMMRMIVFFLSQILLALIVMTSIGGEPLLYSQSNQRGID